MKKLKIVLSTLLILIFARYLTKDNAPTLQKTSKPTYIHELKPKTPAKAVTLILHGLNNHPRKTLRNFAENLKQQGHYVLIGSYSGHYEQDSDRKLISMSYFEWYQQATWLLEKLKTISTSLKIPSYFVGYSTGAVLGNMVFRERPELKTSKQVLFAPALELVLNPFLKQLAYLLPNKFTITSRTHPKIRKNQRLPVKAYRNLFFHIENFQNKPKLLVPTLMILSKKDELIAYEGLKTICDESVCEIFDVTNDWPIKDHVKFHHLIVGAEFIGPKRWKNVMDRVHKFLKEK